jgi:hypothetical protein
VAREACAITSGLGSVRDGERLTAQMARHCGHHKNRLWLWIMRTSTGEQPQSGHGTATNSGWSIKGFPGVLGQEQPARWRRPGRLCDTQRRGARRARSHRHARSTGDDRAPAMPVSGMCRGSQTWEAWGRQFNGTGNLDSGQALTFGKRTRMSTARDVTTPLPGWSIASWCRELPRRRRFPAVDEETPDRPDVAQKLVPMRAPLRNGRTR